jgi:ketosteroid isomerase-like protein
MLPDTYRQATEAFNRRDLESWLAFMDEDVEIESRFSRFGNTRFRGHRSIQRWWDDLGEAWEVIEVALEEVRQVGPDETLALARLNARGRGSGLEVREPIAHRVRYRDGKWLRLSYVGRDEAEAELAGLDYAAAPGARSARRT